MFVFYFQRTWMATNPPAKTKLTADLSEIPSLINKLFNTANIIIPRAKPTNLFGHNKPPNAW